MGKKNNKKVLKGSGRISEIQRTILDGKHFIEASQRIYSKASKVVDKDRD